LLVEQAICIFGIVANHSFNLTLYVGAFFKKENNFWWLFIKNELNGGFLLLPQIFISILALKIF
jgi:hypothetical protein